MKKIIFTILFISQVISISAQVITIQVADTLGNSLAFPEVELLGKIHKIGTENGEFFLPKTMLRVGDTLKISYLGYSPKILMIAPDFLKSKNYAIILKEKQYQLSEILVNTNFNSLYYYKKEIKKNIYPFYKYDFFVNYRFYTNNILLSSDSIKCSFSKPNILFDSLYIQNNEEESKLLNKLLRRSIELSFTNAAFFVKSKYWKHYYCDYLGEQKECKIWEFSNRPRVKRRKEIGGNDNVVNTVTLDNNGIINKIESTFMVQDSTSIDKRYSYNIRSEYEVYNEKIVPWKVVLNLIPGINTNNNEYKIEVNCSAYK